MKIGPRLVAVTGLLAAGAMAPLQAQEDMSDAYRAGMSFLETRTYTQAENEDVLAAFEGLRVADVSDGMDFVGLPDTGLMDPAIHPLWKNTDDFGHRFIGIAVTARYMPTQMPFAEQNQSYEDFRAWEGNWYNEHSSEPFAEIIRPGTALILDEASGADVGSIGSYNIMAWQQAGARGVVTDGTARDTDEIIAQDIPLYYRAPGRGIRPGRNIIESVNMPVEVGGVLVMPGDVVVADGDGVIVVPRAVAMEVADFAHRILEGDKAGRRDLYEQTGRASDPSVE